MIEGFTVRTTVCFGKGIAFTDWHYYQPYSLIRNVDATQYGYTGEKNSLILLEFSKGVRGFFSPPQTSPLVSALQL